MGSCSSSSRRISRDGLVREVKQGDGLLAFHRRELVQEFVEGVSAVEVIEQRLNRHSRTDKDGQTAQDLGIPTHDLVQFHHWWSSALPDHRWWHCFRKKGARGTRRVARAPRRLSANIGGREFRR